MFSVVYLQVEKIQLKIPYFKFNIRENVTKPIC